jgi:HD-GYP domain-containing protein (c-di-GMP phosphodiesterase class II)
MQDHPEIGMRMLEASPYFADILPLVRHHHEKWDGTGYPGNLAGGAIPLGSRIIAICDTYDTMVSERPYKKPISREDTLGTLEKMAGRMFDPTLVALFLSRRIYERVSVDYSSATSF